MTTINENLQQFNIIKSLLPKPNGSVDWQGLSNTKLQPFFEKMAKTEQDSLYHGEGNVLNHTKAVTESLVCQPEYVNGSDLDRLILFLASLLHDIGKIKRTRIEDGKIISPKHAVLGSVMAREFMFKTLGLSGDKNLQNLRESVCFLIKYHSFPPYAILDDTALYKCLKIASNGNLASSFTIEKLCALERADVLGRISNDNNEYLNRIEYLSMLASEYNCFNAPYNFTSNYTKRGYFTGKTKWHSDNLYPESFGDVIILSGLPGTGKDTYISRNYANLPVVSLDEIRVRMGVLPTDNQGLVIQTAKEEAKKYLRKKQPFVYNATNITTDMRDKYVSLFESYNASVKIVFLETNYQTTLERNAGRKSAVPEMIIDKMLSKLEVPEDYESENVSWVIV